MENNNIIIKGIDSTEEFKVPSDIVNMIYNINQYKVEGKDEYILPIKITSLKLVLSYCQYHNYQNPPEIIYPFLNLDQLNPYPSSECPFNLISGFGFSFSVGIFGLLK